MSGNYEIDDGGYVHPYTVTRGAGNGHDITYPGITLRDHYAGQAMQGLVSSGRAMSHEELVREAFSIADEMVLVSRQYDDDDN